MKIDQWYQRWSKLKHKAWDIVDIWPWKLNCVLLVVKTFHIDIYTIEILSCFEFLQSFDNHLCDVHCYPFWSFGDVCPPFQWQDESHSCVLCYLYAILRFTSGVTPAYLLMTNITTESLTEWLVYVLLCVVTVAVPYLRASKLQFVWGRCKFNEMWIQVFSKQYQRE